MKNWKENQIIAYGDLHSSYYSTLFKTKIEIWFADTFSLGANQEKLVNQITEQEKEWVPKAISALMIYYKKTYVDYKKGWEMGGADQKAIEEVLPKEINTEKLLQLITPEEICIKPEKNCENGSFGFALGCNWDEEHGLGVAFKKWKVIDVGDIDVAFNY